MIPEKYDTMVWGIIVLIALAFCTVSILVAVDRLEGQPTERRVVYETPVIQASGRAMPWPN